MRNCSFLLLCAVTLLWSSETDADETLAPYRLNHVTAYPVAAVTTGSIELDGDLGEWRTEAFQTIFQDPGSRDLRACRFALAYDDNGLYIAMAVTDDTPMQNDVDPLGDPFRGWRGDAVQMRFVAPGNQISHWTWWYFTERGQPAVDVRYGSEFQAAVTRVDEDAKLHYRQRDGGYTLEILLPWELLRAKGPGQGEWRTVIEMLFNVFGQEVVRFADCVVRDEGAYYNRPHIWGELRFATENNAGQLLAEQKAVEAKRDLFGREDVPTWGVPIKLEVPADGFMSMAITDADGRNVRTLLARAERTAGQTVEYWDGLDDDGEPLPPGEYGVKALTHAGITPKFVASVMNSGNPPWITADGKGSWGADHGHPIAAAAGSDGWTFLLWSACEAGFDLIGVNAEGRKQWGARIPFGRHGVALTYDSGKVYVAEPNGLLVFNAATGASTSFHDGRSTWPVSEWVTGGGGISALTASPTALFAALSNPGRIVALDKDTLTTTRSWDLKNVSRLAYDSRHKRLYAIADGAVWMLSPSTDAPPRAFIQNGLDAPAGIAVDANGTVYVAQQGARHQVVVFDSRGRHLRSIGRTGGRPSVGKYDPAGMLNPAGISIDVRGRLWVPEADSLIRRFSLWNPRDGSLIDEFFGAASYSVMMAPDPEEPEHVYLHNSRFKVDYDTGRWYPDAIVYRRGRQGADMPGSEQGYGFMGATFTISTYQGRKFTMNGHGGVFAFSDTEFTPLVQVEGRSSNIFQFGGTFFPGASLIRDRRIFQPRGLTAEGAPIYPTLAEAPPIIKGDGPMTRFSNWMDVWPSFESDWNEFYAIASLPDTQHGGIPDGGGGDGIFRFNRDGEILWRYPNVRVFYAIKDQRLAGPGDLMGAVRIVGIVQMPPENGGEIIGIGCYRAYFGLISGDGLFIDKISDDKGRGRAPGFDTFYIENFSGYLFKHPETGKVYLFCGDVDGRILEIQGLETVKRFDGDTVKLTPAEANRLVEARAAAQRDLPAAPTELPVVRVKKAPAPDETEFPVATMQRMELDDGQSASVGLARDDQHLHALFRVDDPSPWKNGAADWKLLFKGGDALDIQLGDKDGRAIVRVFVAPGAREDEFLVVGMWPITPAGMAAAPETYKSPVGQETFARVAKLDGVTVQLARRSDGYTAVVTLPWAELGMTPPALGEELRGDMGILFSDADGTRTVRRRYLFNRETSIVDDIPSEVRLAPQRWGDVIFGVHNQEE